MRHLNERFAVWVVDHVGTMACAWFFAVLALLALPQAWHDTDLLHPLPLVTWLSQSFLQLVLLSIIMVGQDLKTQGLKDHAADLHDALHQRIAEHHEVLHDKLREHSDAVHARLNLLHQMVSGIGPDTA